MNKKDCEEISWILAQYDMVYPEMLEEFFNLDQRIRDNYEYDRTYVRAKNRTPEIYNRMMVERHGKSWELSRDKGTEVERIQLWKLAEDEAFEEVRRMTEDDED